IRGGIHDCGLGAGENKDGAAGLRGGGADHERAPPIAETLCAGSPVVGSGQRAGFRGTVFPEVLEPTGRPHQAAPEAQPDGNTEEFAGCRASLMPTERPSWIWRARPSRKLSAKGA